MNDHPGAEGRRRRKVRNYLLEPRIQLRLGLVNVVLSLAFAATLLGVLGYHQRQREARWLEFSGVSSDMRSILTDYQNDVFVILALLSLVFVVLSVACSILFTHRMVGPTYAFRRHLRALRDGDYHAHTTLRPHDAFEEVAVELNELSAALREREGPR
ncbi:MAG: hypothetical protein R3F62_09970 [Planctomycetota bacterium]